MSWICVEGQCQYGRALVAELQTQYTNLSATVSNPADFASKFQADVATLVAALAQADGFFVHWVPFNPACCTIEGIGTQAQTLLNQMNAYAGAAPVAGLPTSQSPFDAAQSLINALLAGGKWLLVVGAIGVTGLAVAETVKAVRDVRSSPRLPAKVTP